MPPDWLTPDWPAPANVRAVCSTRAGGVSVAPYDSLNLGDHVGDDPQHVAANRVIFQQVLGARPVFLNQVHGTALMQLDADTVEANLTTELAQGLPAVADAAITTATGVACTIMVADCLPVLFSTLDGRCVAAAHAGWRGLAGQGSSGILEETYKTFSALALIDKAQADIEIIAWLGPCIGPQAFEVGDEVRTAFVAHDAQAAPLFASQGGGKWLANLPALAHQRLAKLGIHRVFGNDGSAQWCTVSQPSRFFSHRRDGVSGRLAVSIWRAA
ncbi:laccase [Rhodoferax antarcticus]|nr:laccase [Rhodoferax antarcticus]